VDHVARVIEGRSVYGILDGRLECKRLWEDQELGGRILLR